MSTTGDRDAIARETLEELRADCARFQKSTGAEDITHYLTGYLEARIGLLTPHAPRRCHCGTRGVPSVNTYGGTKAGEPTLRVAVECLKCGVKVSMPTRSEAVAAWNGQAVTP